MFGLWARLALVGGSLRWSIVPCTKTLWITTNGFFSHTYFSLSLPLSLKSSTYLPVSSEKEQKKGKEVINHHLRRLQLAFLWSLRHSANTFALGFAVYGVKGPRPGDLFPTPVPPFSSPVPSLVCTTSSCGK